MKPALAAALLLIAPAVAQAQAGPVRVTEDASGRTVRLHTGQELIVTVQQCIGCAYRWSVTRQPPVLATGAVTDERNGPAEMNGEPVIGGGSTREYHFRAVRTGLGQLVLSNVSFTRDHRVARTLRVNLVVAR